MDPYFALDIAVFAGFFILVVGLGIGMSRGERDSEDYFLAGRGLSWWLIGFSLIAANISSEQFIGMSGQASTHVGLAIASYEWMAAITLVVVAFFFLPKFLRAGIYTIPEFLEYRFSRGARSLMSLLMVLVMVLVSFTAIVYSGALTATVLFGQQELWGGYQITVANASWVIGTLAAVYVVAGGLKACAWADLVQGTSLIVGGAIVTFLTFQALGQAEPREIGLPPEYADAGSIERFHELNAPKLRMVLPRADLILPWTALLIGLWIPNFYYWGLNQYITQRTLGAHSLAAGQKGVVFAAGLKLIIPFIIVIPGMIAFNLFAPQMRELAGAANRDVLNRFAEVRDDPSQARAAFAFNADFAELQRETAQQMLQFNRAVAGLEGPLPDAPDELTAQNNAALRRIHELNRALPRDQQVVQQSMVAGYQHDAAFPLLMRNLVFDHPGIRAFVVAALYGAVISSLAAVLNAASTIFTMDLYRQYLNKNASQSNLVAMGRLCVVLFAATGCWIAPQLNRPEFQGIFTYIQEFQGFLSPGVLAVFVFGLFVPRAPRICGVLGILLSPLVYGILMVSLPNVAFLDRMAITFGVELLVLGGLTLRMPLSQPLTLPEQTKIEMTGSRGAKLWGVVVVLATLALYVVFF